MKNCKNKASSAEQGFTLIEVAIALAIIGLLLIPFLQKLNIDLENRRISNTKSNISTIDQALKKYAVQYGRYPKPSDPSLAPNSAGFGAESPIAVAAMPLCAPGALVVCRTQSVRDTTVDGDTLATNEFVLVGTVPFAALGLPVDVAADGYSSKLTYAVSANLVAGATFADDRGGIALQDNLAVPVPLGSTNGDVHYVIFSAGPDQRGAFSISGNIIKPCGLVTVAREFQNCNNDAIFDDGEIVTGIGRSVAKSSGNNNQDWDDYYAYTTSLATDIWTPIATLDDIRASNSGTMRVATTGAPTDDTRVRVDVNGDVRADRLYTGNLGVTADTTATNAACNGAGTNNYCLAPDIIGRPTVSSPATPTSDSVGIRCYSSDALGYHMAMTGISNGNQVCGAVNVSGGSVPASNCAAGTYPYGIDAMGNILCH